MNQRAVALLKQVGLDIIRRPFRVERARRRADAARRDRQGALSRKQAAHPRRADGDAHVEGDRAPVWHPQAAEGEQRHHHLHLPPPARDLRDRRPRHGAARRPGRRHAAACRADDRGDRAHDGRPQHQGRNTCFATTYRSASEVLRVEGLRRSASAAEVSFNVRHGEIVGVAGLVGSGRTEAMRAVFGADPKFAGRIFVDGAPVTIASPQDAVRHGLSLLTEDRKNQGLLLGLSCVDRTSPSPTSPRCRTSGCWTGRAEQAAASALVERAAHQDAVGVPGRAQPLGRQPAEGRASRNGCSAAQKADLRRTDPRHRRRRQQEIYELLWELAAAGRGIIFVSSDLPELIGHLPPHHRVCERQDRRRGAAGRLRPAADTLTRLRGIRA